MKPELPRLPGTYAVVFAVPRRVQRRIGKFGMLDAPAGYALYIGSARGPGGLAARIERHRAGTGPRRWHIDYLRGAARAVEVWFATGSAGSECEWAAAAASLRGACVPLPGFGSSDCRCPAHLFWFRRKPSARALLRRLRLAVPGHPPVKVIRSG